VNNDFISKILQDAPDDLDLSDTYMPLTAKQQTNYNMLSTRQDTFGDAIIFLETREQQSWVLQHLTPTLFRTTFRCKLTIVLIGNNVRRTYERFSI
jgi:hypothetical protein